MAELQEVIAGSTTRRRDGRTPEPQDVISLDQILQF
jgi:hypothetical protein